MTAQHFGSAGDEPKTGSKPTLHLGLEGRTLGAALAGFGVVTFLGLLLYLSPYSWHEPYRPFLSLEWWGRPLELNIDAALPEINRPLHAVSVSANRKCVWVAGLPSNPEFIRPVGIGIPGLRYTTAFREGGIMFGIRPMEILFLAAIVLLIGLVWIFVRMVRDNHQNR